MTYLCQRVRPAPDSGVAWQYSHDPLRGSDGPANSPAWPGVRLLAVPASRASRAESCFLSSNALCQRAKLFSRFTARRFSDRRACVQPVKVYKMKASRLYG